MSPCFCTKAAAKLRDPLQNRVHFQTIPIVNCTESGSPVYSGGQIGEWPRVRSLSFGPVGSLLPPSRAHTEMAPDPRNPNRDAWQTLSFGVAGHEDILGPLCAESQPEVTWSLSSERGSGTEQLRIPRPPPPSSPSPSPTLPPPSPALRQPLDSPVFLPALLQLHLSIYHPPHCPPELCL